MKILFFNYEYPPLGGGAANATYYFMQEFAKIPGLEIDLVTSSIDANYHEEKIGNSITVYRLPIGKNEKNLHYQSQKELLVYSWRAYKFAKMLVKRNDYDLTHSFFTVPCGYLSLRLKKKFGLPYIVSLRGSDVPGYSERFTFIYSLLTPLIKRIWKDAQFVISNSEGLKALALRSKPEKEIGVIYNGIDVQEFHPQPELHDANEFRLICGTRVTPRKGIRFLIQAMDVLAVKYPQIRLVVVGEGDEKQSLENLVRGIGLSDKVNFLGFVPREKAAEYYGRGDVYVSPSLNEGMANFMLECMALGMPIVATDVGGTRELLTEGENGLIIKVGDYADIAEKIEYLLQNPDLKEKMGKASRERAEKMSWENVAKQYHEAYVETRNLRKMRGK